MKNYLKILVSLFAVVLLISGGKYAYELYQDENIPQEIVKVACIGDSNTYRHGGSYVQEYKYSYHLSKMLGEDYEVKNFGEVGACVNPNGNCSYTSLRVYEAGIEYEADVLLVMLGTNDVWEHNWVSEEYFRKEYLSLIDSYLQTEHVPEVYLCTIPKLYQEDGSTLEHGNGERVTLISNIIRDIANEQGYNIIEINQVTDNHPEWYEKDLLHINKKGAKGIASAMAEEIVDSLNIESFSSETE